MTIEGDRADVRTHSARRSEVARSVVVRRQAPADRWWLLRAGLSTELIGRQYSRAEAPLQLVIAPMRALGLPPGPGSIIEVDGRPAGYIGRNPLSGNLEYWVEPWARGGVGSRAIVAFLSTQRPGDRPRLFFVAYKNPRSRAALLRAFETLGWREGREFRVDHGRWGWRIRVR